MLKIKAQNLTEFALCLSVLTVTFLGMQVYVRRSLQARYKAGADYLFYDLKKTAENTPDAGHLVNPLQQYDPYYATSSINQQYGAGVVVPSDWGRAEGPNIDAKDWDLTRDRPARENRGIRYIDTVTGRDGWQRIGSVQEAD